MIRNRRQSIGGSVVTLIASLCVVILFIGPAFSQIDNAPSASTTLQVAYDQLVSDAKSQMMRDPSLALEHASSAEMLVRNAASFENPEQALKTAMWLRGEALVRVGKPEEGASVIADALSDISDELLATKLGGNLLLAQGRVAGRLSDTKIAAQSFFKAHDIFVALDEPRSEAISLQAIGSIYRDAESYDRALEYYQRAAEVFGGDKALDLSSFNNQANTLKELGRFDDARALFDKALEIAGEMNSPVLEGRILTNIASLEVAAGNLERAESVAQSALQKFGSEGDTDWPRYAYGAIAQVQIAKGDAEVARGFIEQAFDGVDYSTTSLSFEEMHEAAYTIYHALEEHDVALMHHENFKRLSDNAKKVASEANLALLAARFFTAEQSLNIERLKNEKLHKDILLQEAAKRQSIQSSILALAGIVVLFFFLVAVGLVKHRRRMEIVNKELQHSVKKLNEEVAVREATERDLVAAKDEAEEANRAKSTFLATMSHELRTPMNGILGFSKLLLSDDLSYEQREQVEVIEQSGESLLGLINEILDLSQLEAQKLELHPAPFNLAQTLESAAKLMTAKAQEKGLSLAVHVDPDLSPIVNGDGGRIRQIAVNLIGNAVKFTESGTVAVMVGRGATKHGIKISVVDSGIGIPADQIDSLFHRFSQVDDSSSRRFEGTGLGLAICKELVDLMGGEIGVASELGQGSEFWIDIPLYAANNVSILAARAAKRDFPVSDVIVVGGDHVKRRVFDTVLTRAGQKITFAATGAEGVLALSRRSNADNENCIVVVCDDLVDMAASEFAIRIKDGEKNGKLRLVLCSSTYVKSADLASLGFDQKIDQPVTAQSLLRGLTVDLAQLKQQSRPAAVAHLDVDDCYLPKTATPLKALVVDDNVTNRILMSKVLASFGVEVDVAENGRQGVEAVKKSAYDVVYMDIHMPVMDGVEATQKIRELGPKERTIPIVALTALAMAGDREKFLNSGMTDYLAKPLNIDALRANIRSITKLSSAPSAAAIESISS